MLNSLRACRRCAWLVVPDLRTCPNCGTGAPHQDTYTRLDKELRDKIYPTVSRESKGLPGFDDGGGCIFFALFMVAEVLLFKFGTREEGCGGFLSYVLTCLLLGAAIAGGIHGALHGLLIWFHRSQAEALKPRKREIESFLHGSTEGLAQQEKRHNSECSEIDRRIQEIRRALAELSRIDDSQEVDKARRAFITAGLDRLIEKQKAEAWLLYIEVRRWWNSLEPLIYYDSLPPAQDALEKALATIQRCRGRASAIQSALEDRIWPSNMVEVSTVVSQGHRLCDRVEQMVRRQKSNVDLKREAADRYQFTKTRDSLKLGICPIGEPKGNPSVPSKVRDTIDLAIKRMETEIKALWSDASSKNQSRWLQDLLTLAEVRLG